MAIDSCSICGGDGRISNSFGNTTRCSGCGGSGRRTEPTGFRDVTKTKPSHHRGPSAPGGAPGPAAASTYEGIRLVAELQSSALPKETIAKITREIVEYEASHGSCTQTFIKKIRKRLRTGA